MKLSTMQIFFSLIKSVILNETLSQEIKDLLPNNYQNLICIAKKHDLQHLLAFAFLKNNFIPKEYGGSEKDVVVAVYRYERINFELNKLCNILEKANIHFLPLKGAVIRKYYPEPWMRTSCDIDILIHEEDLNKAETVFIENGYVCHEKGSHDVSFFSSNNIHIELHYNLIEDGIANESAELLKNVWNNSVKKDGFNYCYEMVDEMFYFYHIAHMAKHFENGGCGIRPFIDLFILEHLENFDESKRDYFLKQGDLLKFAETIRTMCRIWFEGYEYNQVSVMLENYILQGGVYGSNQNRILLQQQKKGGRFKYLISRVFLPYNELKFHYPILQKHKWLLPFMEVRRWGKIIFCGGIRRSAKEISYNSAVSHKDASDMQKFLKDIGL